LLVCFTESSLLDFTTTIMAFPALDLLLLFFFFYLSLLLGYCTFVLYVPVESSHCRGGLDEPLFASSSTD